MDVEALFQGFPGREEALKNILRYSLYSPLYYRSSVYEHSLRVSQMIQALEPIITIPLDHQRCQLLALIHDDIEIIIGDIQMGNKARMTKEQLTEVARQEQNAILVLEDRFPKMVGPYQYGDLLREAINVQSPEAELMKYADKFDGFCEALHELYAGNTAMTNNVINEYGTIPTPYEYYTGYFQEFQPHHSDLLPLLATDHAFFHKPSKIDVSVTAANRTPHTPETLKTPVGHPQYDWWKQVAFVT